MGMGNTEFVLPVGGLGGGGGFFGGGTALGAFAGGALGSLLFNGGLGYGFGGGRGGYGGGYGGSGPIIVNSGSDHGCCSTAELDALTGLQASVNGVGLSVIQGQNSANLAACQGFSGVVASNDRNTAQLQNSMNQGFNGIYTAITTGDAGIQQSLCQGFNGIQQAISDCCCKTQTAIHAEGEATRGLIQQNFISELQTRLCDSKAENAALKSQAFVAASQQAQTAEFRAALRHQTAIVGGALGAYRLGRIDERDGTAADGGAAAGA